MKRKNMGSSGGAFRPPPPVNTGRGGSGGSGGSGRSSGGGKGGRGGKGGKGRKGGKGGKGGKGQISNKVKLVQNEYQQHYVDTGERPQNFIRETDPENTEERFNEYPKLKRLLELKTELIEERAVPAQYLKADLLNYDLSKIGNKFDVIYIDPPWEEYARRAANISANIEPPEYWGIDQIADLQIEAVADSPSFIFIWCGCGGGLLHDPEKPCHLDEGRCVLRCTSYTRDCTHNTRRQTRM